MAFCETLRSETEGEIKDVTSLRYFWNPLT